ncbi:YdcF family protein [Mariprofundus erugo]|uniref:YdcF family protein n=1 Tax=Mariprofundus erugo TaxID=2528639 RepID=A0A5R9GHJ7_9PROT|nr:YdcF family protein [Mariprofundus erugo]TLS66261.1 YdcF family protein [Mariprofundus erugo]
MGLLISKVVAQLLLPPGGLVLAGVLGFVLRRHLAGRILLSGSFLLLWLLSTEPVRDMLLHPLEQRYAALADQQLASLAGSETAIVVLGGGLYEKAPEYGGRDMLHNEALMRTLYGADLAVKGGLDIYVTGGVLEPDRSEPEGAVMARMLVRFGVDSQRIHAESQALTTWENGTYIHDLTTKAGVKQIILVTTAWHMPRSVWVFESLGMHVIAAPCDYVAKQTPYDVRSYFPRWNVLADSGNALHEYLGLLWYRLSRHSQ